MSKKASWSPNWIRNACEIGREYGQDAICVWTPTDWQIPLVQRRGSRPTRLGGPPHPTPAELAAIDAVYRELALASPYVPLLIVHAAVDRRVADAPEEAMQLELAAAHLAAEYHGVRSPGLHRIAGPDNGSIGPYTPASLWS